MGESHLERFGVFFGLRFERQQWFHSGYDSTDRRIACPELFRALDRASTRFSSITDLKPARSLALDDDLRVHRPQFDLAKGVGPRSQPSPRLESRASGNRALCIVKRSRIDGCEPSWARG